MVRELDTIDARTLLEEPFEAPRWVVLNNTSNCAVWSS